MEPSIVFAEFIIGMAALHLVDRTSDQVAKWWMKSQSGQGKVSQKSAQKVVRGDWYVFFSCNDLLGVNPEKKQEQSGEIANKQRPRRDPRPVVRL